MSDILTERKDVRRLIRRAGLNPDALAEALAPGQDAGADVDAMLDRIAFISPRQPDQRSPADHNCFCGAKPGR
ncbi:MAG: hypothetical protein AB7G06_07840 [Bdellovibrionales bacterium]